MGVLEGGHEPRNVPRAAGRDNQQMSPGSPGRKGSSDTVVLAFCDPLWTFVL